MRHVVVGTAGHVDHGKTTLVQALTGVYTDRLPEEQRRGITIELGFAPWRVSDDALVSLVDVPGHRRLVHTMIAGASGIDIVLLVVAADEGVMPQTREHVAVCRLLGVGRAVVAVTKLDRVDRELAELAAEEALELTGAAGIEAQAVLVSGKTGEGCDALKVAMLAAIDREDATNPRRAAPRVRLSVDRVFSVRGAGTVATGTLVEGSLRLGEALRVLGPERELSTSARALHVHGASQDDVAAPTRLAVNLAGVALEAVSRGDVITSDPFVRATSKLDVWIEPLEPLRRGTEASLFVGTARTTARIQPIPVEHEGPGEALGQGMLARLRLATPLVVFGGDRFVLRGAQIDGPSGAVVGGGLVLDARPPRERAAKRTPALLALFERDARRTARALAAERGLHVLRTEELESRLALRASEVERAARDAAAKGELVRTRQGGFLTAPAVAELERRALSLVAEHHTGHPLEPGMRLSTLREQLAAAAGAEARAEVLARLAAGKKPALVVAEDLARLPGFRVAKADARAEQALGRLTSLLLEAALQGVSENVAVEALGGDVKQARAALAHVVRDKLAIKAGDLWFAADAVVALRKNVLEHLDRSGKLTIADFKAMTGLGRKQTIPLLEHLDREKVTKRVGTGDRVCG